MFGQRRRFLVLGLVLLGLTAWAGLRQPALLQDLRNFEFDSFQRLDPPAFDPESPVRIVAVDEPSLARLGQWPWPRTRLAALVDKLRELGAAAIAFDIIFAEPDRTSPEVSLAALPDGPVKRTLMTDLAGSETNDAVFARALGASPALLAVTAAGGTAAGAAAPGATAPGASSPAATAKAGFVVAGDSPDAFLPAFPSLVQPLPVLLDAANGVGATNWLPDHDQTVRRVPLLVRAGETTFPSLALEALRVAQGASTFVLRGANASGQTAFGVNTGLNAVKVGDIVIGTAPDGSIRPRYTHSTPERYMSAGDLLDGRVDPGLVRGRIIFVGTTAVGLGDVRATPLDSVVPGVEVHAQIVEDVLSGRILSRPDWAQGAELYTALLAVALLAVVVLAVPPWLGALLTGAGVAAMLAGAWFAYDRAGVLIDAAFPAAAMAVTYLSYASLLWQSELRAKRQVRAAFGKFVAPAVVARIAERPELLVLSGETRELTILFSDLRSFSTISEGLQAHEVARFLNTYLTPMTDVILEHEGTVDKYIGDAIVAFWNAPLDVPDHTRRAVDAALGMRRALAAFNRDQEQRAAAGESVVRNVRMGCGLNFGACSVGNMGSVQRFDYSALGDPVNVAARLEALTKSYVVDVLASIGVVERVPDYAWLEVDEVKVKGRSALTKLFILAGDAETARAPAFAAWRDRHAQMLAAWRAGAAAEAEALARRLSREVDPFWRGLYEKLAETYADHSAVRIEPAAVDSVAHRKTDVADVETAAAALPQGA